MPSSSGDTTSSETADSSSTLEEIFCVHTQIPQSVHIGAHRHIHAHYTYLVLSLPGKWHSPQADTCGPQACLGILQPGQRCAPDTERPRRGCSAQSVFQPCSEATSAAGRGMSGNPLRFLTKSRKQTHRHVFERTQRGNDDNDVDTHTVCNGKVLKCVCVLYLYMRSISISGSSWCSFILTVSDRIMCRLNTRSWTCKIKNEDLELLLPHLPASIRNQGVMEYKSINSVNTVNHQQ